MLTGNFRFIFTPMGFVFLLSLMGNYTPWQAIADDAISTGLSQAQAEQVRRFFRLLSPDDDDRAEMSKWFAQLGHDKFTVRQQAMEELSRLPLIPPDLFASLKWSGDLEAEARIQRLRSSPSATGFAEHVGVGLPIHRQTKIDWTG